MKRIFLFTTILISFNALAQMDSLNSLFRQQSPYLQIDKDGKIIKPDSAESFKSTTNGFDSRTLSLKRIQKGTSNYYVSISKTEYGRGSVVEASNAGVVAVTNCNGNFKPQNTTGISCSTLSYDKCVDLFRNFNNIENPAMTNSIVRSAFKDSEKAEDASFATAFRNNLRQCSDVFMMINNMEGNQNGFALDKEHEKVLQGSIGSYPVRSSSVPDLTGSLHQSTMSVLNKAEIFTKCGDLLRHDQVAKKRTTLMPPTAEQKRSPGAAK